MKLELISFPLCPYVQRSVITLKYKKVPFKLTHIDLESPPEWFAKVSPLGKVPVLIVDEKTPIFESAVINEFIDETTGKPLHPADPLQRAMERAWIEFASSLLIEHYGLTMETDPAEFDKLKGEYFDSLTSLENVLGAGPYFRGQDFGLVDAASAPIFVRMFLSEKLMSDERWRGLPKVRAWGEALTRLPEVRESVPADFSEQMIAWCREAGSLLF